MKFVSLHLMRKISIKERLILYFVLLSLISIAIVSLFSIFEAKKGIRERAFSQLILLRDLRREQIQSLYSLLGNQLSALSGSGKIREATLKLAELQDDDSLSLLSSDDLQLLNLVMDERFCKSIHILTRNQKLFRLTRRADEYILERDSSFVLPGIFNTIFYNSDTSNGYKILEYLAESSPPGQMITSTIGGKGIRSCGALLMDLRPEALYSIIYDKRPGTGLGRTAEAYLVGTDTLMRSPSRFIPEAIMKIKVNSEGFRKAMAEKEGTGIYEDYRGIKVLGAYGRIETAGYTQIILAEIDVGEAMIPLNEIRSDILIVSALILVIIFIITWFLAYGITRPLTRLKNAVNYISSGNYTQRLDIETDDEIGELTLAFNTMSEEISSATQELKEKEESLRHFYEATLDGIVLHDEGKMVLFNASMLRMTGYREDEFSAFSITDILRETRNMQCDKNADNEMFETVLILKDKSNLPVEVQESCVEYQGKNIRASVIRDISARKKMEEELADERNKRVRAVFDGKDSEQQRLSRELHDGLGQQLAAGRLILESSLYAEGKGLKTKILEAQQIFDNIIKDIRRISHDLSPSILTEFGLKAAMENLCRNMFKATGIAIDFKFDVGDYQPDDLTSSYLYRITQESLNNIQLHAAATNIRLVLKTDRFGILLEIADNGCGFELKNVPGSGGTGLYNIRERVNILKGQLNITSKPGKGTRIQVRVPIEKNSS
jgi:PAS domain S-box-containing protein